MRSPVAVAVISALVLTLAPPRLVAATPPAAGAAGETIAVKNADLFQKSLEAAAQALEQYGIYEAPQQARRVAEIGYRVAQQSGFKEFPFTFYLVEMPEPNALALPGGQIFVTRGMLDLGLDDDMLAALLGHEIAHVVARHGVRMQRRAILLNLLSQAALIGVILTADNSRREPRHPEDPYDLAGAEENRKGDLVQGTAAAGLVLGELLLRSYSREFEDEADQEGQRWAAAAGYDPAGADELMSLMRERIPESRQYGYWRTHPFFTDRISAAKARGVHLKRLPARGAETFREQTQAALLDYLDQGDVEEPQRLENRPPPAPPTPPPGRRGSDGPPEVEPRRASPAALIKRAALLAWPQGGRAEALRRERLEARRDAELAKPQLGRDYGRLIADYRAEIAEIEALTPESPLLASLRDDLRGFEEQAARLYPEASGVLAGGVYETPFLEVFQSNWPEAPEAPAVALQLADAYSRLGRQTDAVAQYLRAWEVAPASADGKRAGAGLRQLAPYLERLAALQQLADQERDAELARLAAERLAKLATSYGGLENGAEYLRRFPEGDQTDSVAARLETLAHQLYSEVVLYQSVGEHLKAMERIQLIMTHAPLSPAADRLRERAVIGET